jgi:hypothetical protein
MAFGQLIAVENGALPNIRRTEIVMPKGKLTPEGEVIAAYGAAMVAAFQVLINCLEESDALLPAQFPDALGVYMEMVKSREGDVSDMMLPCSTTFGRLHWIS